MRFLSFRIHDPSMKDLEMKYNQKYQKLPPEGGEKNTNLRRINYLEPFTSFTNTNPSAPPTDKGR